MLAHSGPLRLPDRCRICSRRIPSAKGPCLKRTPNRCPFCPNAKTQKGPTWLHDCRICGAVRSSDPRLTGGIVFDPGAATHSHLAAGPGGRAPGPGGPCTDGLCATHATFADSAGRFSTHGSVLPGRKNVSQTVVRRGPRDPIDSFRCTHRLAPGVRPSLRRKKCAVNRPGHQLRRSLGPGIQQHRRPMFRGHVRLLYGPGTQSHGGARGRLARRSLRRARPRCRRRRLDAGPQAGPARRAFAHLGARRRRGVPAARRRAWQRRPYHG
mmetsp:Transcript_5276/g.18724  ORF Transcript_5276/g.18724 Transcript_5276/m.18724 type:complete len:268 (-) Transcript_5276:413-1216(-)